MYVEGMMRNKNYLLSIREFLEGENSGMLLKEAFCKVDVKRRSKAERMRTDRGKAACLGAGLLLQLAVREAVGACGDAGRRDMGEEIHSEDVPRRFSVSRLLESISFPYLIITEKTENLIFRSILFTSTYPIQAIMYSVPCPPVK